jgi:uncharacterized repeat protein (TIGR03803 family)
MMKRSHVHAQAAKATLSTVLAIVVLLLGASHTAQAQTPTVLYNFLNGSSDAAFPTGSIVQGRDGFMYGVGAFFGRGANNTGAVYKISPAGVEKVFFNFPATFNGCISGLTLGTDGNFYGTCTDNTSTGQGSLYRLTPAGVFTDMHDFASGGGSFPPIQASDGNFYGVVAVGVYKMTPAGVFTMIHTFTSPDGQPISNLTQASDGNLYGTLTLCSNGNRGCVYKVSTAGVFAEVYLFVDATGSFPCSGVIQGTDGKLYGATGFGGANTDGDLYNVTTAGVEADLHAFNNTTDGACNPGSFPVVNLLQVNDGNFYGTNYGGANANNGSIYKLTAAHVFSAFLFPGNNVDGSQPFSTLIQNTNGKIYGTTNGGGTNSTGTFFSVNTGDAAFVLLQETSGRVGSKIGILGQGFSASSVVKFNGVTATAVTRTGSTFLLATVPAGATNGFVTVTTGATTLTSSKKFVVHDSWSSGKAIPTPVNYPAGAGTINGKIYVVGGATAAGNITTNQVYNIAGNSWTTGQPLPTATAGGASAVVNNILYIFGGSVSGSQVKTVWAYSPASNAWTAKANMLVARSDATAVVDGTAVYVIGGHDTGRSTVVAKYDSVANTWTTEASLITGKSELAAALLGTTIVAADGYTVAGDNGDNEAYNVSMNSWSTLTADPHARNASCSAGLLGQLYVAGGGTNGSPESVVDSYSTISGAWTNRTAMPQSVIAPGSAVSGGLLYCISGSSSDLYGQGTLYKNVQAYQP